MKNEIRDKFPSWTVLGLPVCLSDDADSLLSCAFLYAKGEERRRIAGFYDFWNTYLAEGENEKELIAGVDIDQKTGCCWGNHATIAKNENAANLNTIYYDDIQKEGYISKYPGSTLLTIMSYYRFNFSQLTDEQLALLCIVDGTYFGYYPKVRAEIRQHWLYWMRDVLEIPQIVRMVSSCPLSGWEEVANAYNVAKGKIWVGKATMKLETDIDLEGLSELFEIPIELPTQRFIKRQSFTRKTLSFDEYRKQRDILTPRIYSDARTSKNKICISLA